MFEVGEGSAATPGVVGKTGPDPVRELCSLLFAENWVSTLIGL